MLKGEAATRDDLLDWLRQSHARTVLDSDELAMLEGVLAVSETQARDVMVPRSQMAVLERDAPRDELLKAIVESGHSRFPVFGDDREEVVGILLAKDVLRHFVDTPDQDFDITRYIRPATFIPESKRLNTLLKEFRAQPQSHRHRGGRVRRHHGTAHHRGRARGDRRRNRRRARRQRDCARSRSRARADTMCMPWPGSRSSTTSSIPSLDDENYDTVGGLVMHELGHLPRKGETLQFGEFRFRVLQADRRRVHSVEVTRGSSLPADGDVAVA